MRRAYWIPQKKLEVIGWGASETGVSSPASNDGVMTVLCVGRLGRHKGQMWLLEAYRHARDQFNKPVRLVLVGRDEGDEDTIRRFVTTSGMESEVVITGEVSDQGLAQWYAASGLFRPLLPLRSLWLGIRRGDAVRPSSADPRRGGQPRGAGPRRRGHATLRPVGSSGGNWSVWSTTTITVPSWGARGGSTPWSTSLGRQLPRSTWNFTKGRLKGPATFRVTRESRNRGCVAESGGTGVWILACARMPGSILDSGPRRNDEKQS